MTQDLGSAPTVERSTPLGTACKRCGSEKPPETTCSRCGGYGMVTNGGGDPGDCPECGCSGMAWPPYCPDCSGFRSMQGWLHNGAEQPPAAERTA